MHFFWVFLHHSQFFHLPPAFIAKYPKYSTNQVCFPAKSLKKPPSAKQRWSQQGQAKPSQAKVWEADGERRRTLALVLPLSCFDSKFFRHCLKSSFYQSIISFQNQGTFGIQITHRLLCLEYFNIGGGLDIFSSEMGSRQGSGAALPNLDDTS